MKIKKLHIQNYKSLVNLEIIEPNPFTVFAGSNGAGKSNIFEALEFLSKLNQSGVRAAFSLFGDIDDLLFRNRTYNKLYFGVQFNDFSTSCDFKTISDSGHILSRHNFGRFYDENTIENDFEYLKNKSYNQFFDNFSRVFVNDRSGRDSHDAIRLNISSSNLEKVLSRILADKFKKEEILIWLDLLVPGFSNIDIVQKPYSGTDSLIIYEKGTNKPFTKNLLSDGTKNILALLTAVYQSDEPQFLCIEEPENGLNPKVQKELVNLFRQKCEDEGHYIWLNTHSQTIVNQLTPRELILVDKVDGETKIKQLTDFDTSGLSMDEAWLTNTLGGGIPW
jgi:predicted ATPase